MPEQAAPIHSSKEQEVPHTAIAIVGMACRVPGADNISEFWQLLVNGKESLSPISDEALAAAGVNESLRNNPNYVKSGMFLNGMKEFDPSFFGLSPLDGKILDPQHRHFLECAWEAFEHAGYDPARFTGSIGMYAGSGHNAYLHYNLLSHENLLNEVGFFLLRHTGNDKDFLSTRASYCFNLRGPSINVQTACSTSLVAIHLGCQALLNGECDMAVAGAVTIELPHHQGYLYRPGEILSKDGHCRPFDESSGGTVFGSGVGVLILKRLYSAIADGDTVHGIIRSSAVNNDGANKMSYLAPSVDGQAAAIYEALAVGDIPPESISYIETHGTGTQLGDPIEIAALSQAYGEGSSKKQFCAVGSVKSNIGHLDTAAGVAGVIKVVLSMQHKTLPPTLHYNSPNKAIDFPSTPFYVNDKVRSWVSDAPLRAGVSSLGVGGTNAHLILEEARPLTVESKTAETQRLTDSLVPKSELLVFSARTESALQGARDKFSQFFNALGAHPSTFLTDAAYTLATGRREFRKRAFLVADSSTDAGNKLERNDKSFVRGESPATPREVAFMFAGGGAQYPGMGECLYLGEPVFKAAVDECLSLLSPLLNVNLKELLYPATSVARTAATQELERPSLALPALFVTQYAQARLWQSWGVLPTALIGHSLGENTAACLAGVFSLKDALGLVVLRGELFESIEDGGMLGIELSEEQLRPLLGDTLSIAALNAPSLAVASGPAAALHELEQYAEKTGIGYSRVRIAIAAHSSMLDRILTRFGDYLRSITLSTPKIPFISNVTGNWITSSEATDPDYWVRHLRSTVRFAEGITTLLKSHKYAFLEVGPGRTLATLTSINSSNSNSETVVTSLRHPDDATPDRVHMLNSLGQLWIGGVEISWKEFYRAGESRKRVPLPTYSFDHIECWVEPPSASKDTEGVPAYGARAIQPHEFLYQPSWARMGLPLDAAPLGENSKVLVMLSEHPLGEAIVGLLRTQKIDHITISHTASDRHRTINVNPGNGEEFTTLISNLVATNWTPTHVLNLWLLDLSTVPEEFLLLRERALAYDSLFYLAQALGMEGVTSLGICVVTSSLFQVAAESVLQPQGALALGALRVLPKEFPEWRCRLVDLDHTNEPSHLPTLADVVCRELADTLLSPIAAEKDRTTVITRRSSHRFIEILNKVNAAEPNTCKLPAVRAGGVYLITGGLGGLGIVSAGVLAAQQPVTLILVSRRAFPVRSQWDSLVQAQAYEATTIEQLLHLEQLGSRIEIESVDVSDETAVCALKVRASRFGEVRGIIHTAGVIDDDFVINKDIGRCSKVLAPKFVGTCVLQQVFGNNNLDFFILFSSTSALFGMPGQIDYSAANSFLDAFARWGETKNKKITSINWCAWKDTGMARKLADGTVGQTIPTGRLISHPLIDHCCEHSPSVHDYYTTFSVPHSWVLSEHRIKDGPALLPGTAFLELACGAWLDYSKSSEGIQLSDVNFYLPFIVHESQKRTCQVRLTTTHLNGTFELLSVESGESIIHAQGSISCVPKFSDWMDVSLLKDRCSLGQQIFSDSLHHPHLDLGSRWGSLSTVRIGKGEALLEIQVPQEFAHELAEYKLHPALLDMATAGAQAIITGHRPLEEFYVPVGYRKISISEGFPITSFSHVELTTRNEGVRGSSEASPDEVEFNVRVADSSGVVFLKVDGFRMRRLPSPQVFRDEWESRTPKERPMLNKTLELGVSHLEGAQSLDCILRRAFENQIVVSAYSPNYVRNELEQLSASKVISSSPAFDPDAASEIFEIERVLSEISAIDRVVVRCFLDEGNAKRFVAFYVPSVEHFVTISEVRRLTKNLLPFELLPSQYIELDELPKDPSGALLRKELTDPLSQERRTTPPKSSTEKVLATIWSSALGVPHVGLEDNFFDLGGYSLLSTRVIIQVYKRLNIRLDQASMVLNTLEQTAKEIDQKLAPSKTQPAPLSENSQGEEPSSKSSGLFRSLLRGTR